MQECFEGEESSQSEAWVEEFEDGGDIERNGGGETGWGGNVRESSLVKKNV